MAQRITGEMIRIWMGVLSTLFIPFSEIVFVTVLYYVAHPFLLFTPTAVLFTVLAGVIGVHSAQRYGSRILSALQQDNTVETTYLCLLGHTFYKLPHSFIPTITLLPFALSYLSTFLSKPLLIIACSTSFTVLTIFFTSFVINRAEQVSTRIEHVLLQQHQVPRPEGSS